MNLFELFDKEKTSEREYYHAKKPLAVILTILGLGSLVLCTPVGAAYLGTWTSEILPTGGMGAAWAIAIGFDLTFSYLLSHFFCDVFTGISGRQTYTDIPTLLLTILFGATTLAWSFWGGDMRKANATANIAIEQRADLDKGIAAITENLSDKKDLTATKKGIPRSERKNNEAIAEVGKADATKIVALSGLAQSKQELYKKGEDAKHEIIDNGKMIVVGAYLFLIVTIGCVEYIKSQKSVVTTTPTTAKEKVTDNVRDIAGVKKKTDREQAIELRAKLNPKTHKPLYTYRDLGTRFGVSHAQVQRWCKQSGTGT